MHLSIDDVRVHLLEDVKEAPSEAAPSFFSQPGRSTSTSLNVINSPEQAQQQQTSSSFKDTGRTLNGGGALTSACAPLCCNKIR